MDYKSVVYNAARDGNLNRLKVISVIAMLPGFYFFYKKI